MILKSPTILVSNQRIFLSLNIGNCKSVRKLGATIFVFIHINKQVIFPPANLRHIIHKPIIAEVWMRKHWNHLKLTKCSVTDSEGKSKRESNRFSKDHIYERS